MSVAGNFTCAELVDVQLKADQIWADNTTRKDYIAHVDAVLAIKNEQTANLVAFEEKGKDITAKISWIKDCDTTVSETPAECTVGGDEAGAACDSHTLDLFGTIGFTVDEKTFRSSIFSKEEVIAKQMLVKMKALDEFYAGKVVTEVNSFVGTNAYAGSHTVVGTTTEVTNANFTASLIPYLILAGKKNKFVDPFMLSGTNLYTEYLNAQFNAGNSDGSGDKARMDAFRKYFDVINVDAELDPAFCTFLIDRGAVAFVTKNYWETTPQDFGDNVGKKWSVPSKNIPGVMYDVTYKITCSGDDIKHNFSLQTKGGIFLNPRGCDTTNTGVLKFKKVA